MCKEPDNLVKTNNSNTKSIVVSKRFSTVLKRVLNFNFWFVYEYNKDRHLRNSFSATTMTRICT